MAKGDRGPRGIGSYLRYTAIQKAKCQEMKQDKKSTKERTLETTIKKKSQYFKKIEEQSRYSNIKQYLIGKYKKNYGKKKAFQKDQNYLKLQPERKQNKFIRKEIDQEIENQKDDSKLMILILKLKNKQFTKKQRSVIDDIVRKLRKDFWGIQYDPQIQSKSSQQRQEIDIGISVDINPQDYPNSIFLSPYNQYEIDESVYHSKAGLHSKPYNFCNQEQELQDNQESEFNDDK